MPKKHRSSSSNTLGNPNKVYFNFLRLAKPSIRPEVLRIAPPSVIKSICNAASNAAFNPKTHLSPAQRKLLARHRRQIQVLTSRAASLKKKRETLQKGGVLPFLPVLLGTALATLGAHIFSK